MKLCRVIIFTAVSLQVIFSTLIVAPGISAEILATDKHLVLYDTGVVYDSESGLEWYLGPDQGMSWKKAVNWTTGLNAVGGGWRMPTRSELETLFRISDGINDITPLLDNSGYWIWAGQTEDSSSKWVFSFSYGGEGWNGEAPADGGRAVAVRTRRSSKY